MICSGVAEPVAVVVGIFLLAGLWTPVTSTLAALDAVWIALSSGPPQTSMHWFQAVVALSLSMLGPGAWSVDARLFGRKRLDFGRVRGRKTSL